jgi:anti-sigma factor RsiW
MICRDAQELIPLHVGDDLPAGEAEPLEAHLEDCVLCEAEYMSYAQARAALLLLRGEEAPTAAPLWAAVADGLDGSPSLEIAPRRRGVLRMLIRGGIAAALLVGVTAPLWLPQDDSSSNTTGETASSEDSGPRVEPVSPEDLREFLNSFSGTIPAPDGEEGDTVLMAPANNRGQM